MSSRRNSARRASRDERDGNAIGLTRAFSPVEDDDLTDAAAEEPYAQSAAARHAPRVAPDPPRETVELSADDLEGYSKRGRHARPAQVRSDDQPAFSDQPCDQSQPQGQPQDQLQPCFDSAPSPQGRPQEKAVLFPHTRKSRRVRRVLIVIIVLLLVLLAGCGVLIWQLVQTSENAATQQTLQSDQDSTNIVGDQDKDVSTVTTKTTTVPNLASLLGMTQEEAVLFLQHGAQISVSREVNEEGNPIKSEVRIVLTDEPADTRSGAPTVYAGLDAAGRIIQAGYSAATSSLGYGSLSFSDAVRNESIVEKTLSEAGVSVPAGTVALPNDKMEYSTYASDGTTLTKEYCSFAGEVDGQGAVASWSAVLSYDYSMANATGNLADTIRTIYVYVNAHVEAAQDAEGEAEAGAGAEGEQPAA